MTEKEKERYVDYVRQLCLGEACYSLARGMYLIFYSDNGRGV
jgi:hypothetical protein